MPWTLGDEVHVANLHARENVHVGGVNAQSDWNATGTAAAILNKPTTITAAQADAIDANTAALSTKEAILTFTNDVLNTVVGGSISRPEGTNTVVYTPPDLSSYALSLSPTFTGTVTLPSTTSIGNISSSELAFLEGVTSAIQTQLDSKQSSGTYQIALDDPVVAAPSGHGSLTLTSNTGYNTLLTYTPPDLTGFAPKTSPSFTGNVDCPGTLSLVNSSFGAVLRGFNNGNGGGCHDFRIDMGGANVTRITRFPSSGFTQIHMAGNVDVHTGYVSSDDRIKHNEEALTGVSLAVVRQLQPHVYDKARSLRDPSNTIREAGFIAQHVQQIPELVNAGAVHVGTDEELYSLNYNSIFTYAVAAIQELDAIVQAQAARVAVLEARLAAAGL